MCTILPGLLLDPLLIIPVCTVTDLFLYKACIFFPCWWASIYLWLLIYVGSSAPNYFDNIIG